MTIHVHTGVYYNNGDYDDGNNKITDVGTHVEQTSLKKKKKALLSAKGFIYCTVKHYRKAKVFFYHRKKTKGTSHQ